MAVEVTQNLTQVTISSVGVAGVNGTSGTSGFSIDSGSFLTTSSYQTDSASFDSRISAATNEQDLSSYLSASIFNSLSGSYATTGSNTFNDDQIVNGFIELQYNGVTQGSIGTGPGGFSLSGEDGKEFGIILSDSETGPVTWTFLPDGQLGVPGNIVGAPNLATTGSNTFVGNQQITGSITIDSDNRLNLGPDGTYVGLAEGALLLNDSNGYIQLNAQNSSNSNYGTLIVNANNDESFFSVSDNGRINADIKFTTSGSLNISTIDNTATLLLNDIPYDAHLATTGSNTFNGNQTVNGSIILDNNSVIKDNVNQSISFGVDAAESGQGVQSTAIGSNAGQTDQGNGATAIGVLAGNLEQGQSAVAVGALAGSTQQGEWAIALGTQAGGISQGNYAIAIGNLAGGLNQAANSIVISATGVQLDNTTANSLKIAPIRINEDGSQNVLVYNTTTKEVSYSADKFATTGSNTFIGNQTISGSLNVSGSVVLPNHSTAPASPASGSLYFNTTDFHFYGWNGETWTQLDN